MVAVAATVLDAVDWTGVSDPVPAGLLEDAADDGTWAPEANREAAGPIPIVDLTEPDPRGRATDNGLGELAIGARYSPVTTVTTPAFSSVYNEAVVRTWDLVLAVSDCADSASGDQSAATSAVLDIRTPSSKTHGGSFFGGCVGRHTHPWMCPRSPLCTLCSRVVFTSSTRCRARPVAGRSGGGATF